MSDLLELAVQAAQEAGALLLQRFREPARGLASKTSLTDMVSDADRDAEARIVARILGARPDDAILGEEETARDGSSGIRWVVDPLDGTTNFLYGQPDWCVSIACEDASGTLAGVVHDACRAETFTAVRGEGAHLNGAPIRVSACEDLSGALVATGFGYRASDRERQGALVARILPRIRDIRRCGSAASELAWVACGRADAFYEGPIMPWDVAAGLLLVREAGGLTGTLPNDGAVAAGPGIFRALEDLLRGT